MYKCCIFDLDGTLINTIYSLQKTTNMVLKSFELREITVEETRRFVGDGYKKLVERALIACGDEKLKHYEEALERYLEYFKEWCLYRIEPYEGIRELLKTLKDEGIQIAVASNKPHDRAVENVEFVFGKGYFDVICGEQEERGIRRKPAPDMALLCAKELGVSMGECLYLGDTDIDMRTGLAAGADTVGVLWGFRDRDELESCHPAYLAAHPSQVADIVRQVNGAE